MASVLNHIDGFISDAGRASDLGQVRAAMHPCIEQLGFGKFAYLRVVSAERPRVPLYVTDYPPSWTEHYLKNDFKRWDMVRRHSVSALVPFTWADVQRRYVLTRPQQAVFHDGIEVGLKAGGAIPIHGPHNTTALLAVANDCSHEEFHKLFGARKHALHLIAAYTHETIMRLWPGRTPEREIRLSAREIEVLTWTALGKTRWEIGEILALSDETVKNHLARVCRRLGAVNKTQAVAIALMHGLISP